MEQYISIIKNSKLVQIFKEHSFFSIYIFLFSFICLGVGLKSGLEHFPELFVFSSSFILSYFFFFKGLRDRLKSLFARVSFRISEKWIYGLILITILGVILHLIELGGLPFLSIIGEEKADVLSEFRRQLIVGHSRIWAYFMGFSLKALLPFLIFYLGFKNHKLFIPLLLMASLYAFCFLQKSLILPITLPVLILSLSKKQYLKSFSIFSIILVFIVGLTMIANPKIVKAPIKKVNTERVKKAKKSKAYRIAYGITRRVVYVPGMTVSEWFRCVPEEKPFLGFQAYGFMKKITGKPHINYAKELYPLIYPHYYYDRGLRGNVNVASFMYDYVAFGKIGLLYSGILLAFLFVFIEALFKNWIIKLSINIYFILALSSSALSIIIFSGGWGLMLILYFAFRKYFELPETLETT